MGVNYNPKIVTDGLVLCYDAANDRSYPNTGTTWTDLAGSNDGTLTNGPTFDTTNGGSIVFDGTNDRVAIPIASLSSNYIPNVTYEAVVKFDSLGWRTVFSQDNGSGTGRIFLGVHGTNSKLVTFITGSALQPDFSALSTGTIYHVAFILSQAELELNSSIKIALNGVMDTITSVPSLGYNGTGDINIGCEPGAGGGFLDGNVLAVRIYNRPLGEKELFQNYRTIKGRYS